MCSTTYLDSSAHNYAGGWQSTYDSFLAWSALADEFGFDWISVSEHHYAPLIIALLGPLASQQSGAHG